MSKKKLRLGFEGKEKTVDVQVPDGTPDPWGTDAKLDVVGKDHTRVDGVLKVTGRAKYSYDVHPEAMIFAKLLRSPHAHARVVRVDLSRAKALKGVLYTEGQEGTVVHYPGQHVAGVAAETEEILDDALRLIHVEYELLPHVVTVDAARAEGAPPVLERRNKNVFRERGRGDGDLDATEAAHQQADVVLERTYTTQIQTHSALETHGCVCEWKDGELTIWASTQGTFSVRNSMARALDVPQAKVRTITEHMGGGFGAKFGIRYWDRFCAKAAQMTGRPVRYLLDRKEEHLVGGNRPDSRQVCKFSAKKDGTLMGADVRSWGTAGTSARAAGVFNPGIYKFRATYKETYNVLTNTTEGRAFRAPRYPQGVFALEGMLDEIAEEIGMDPLELRKKNDVHSVRLAQYEVGAKQIGWERRNERPGSGKGPLKRGIGMASGLWHHTGRRGSAVRCRVDREGSVTLSNGAQDIGTGTRTILAVLGAEELGLQPQDITVRLGNTDDPPGPASGGSTTASTLGPAARDAAWQAKQVILEAVADALGGDAGKLDLKRGKVVGAPKDLSFKQACGLLGEAVETLGRWHKGRNYPRFEEKVAGCQFAEVEVDVETGHVQVLKIVAVQDCGRVIDPLLARSQINGGVIQGLSYALYEDRVMDPGTGDMLNANLLDYKIAGSREMPEIVSIPFTVSNGINSVGMSGLGEPPTVPTAGAIANAVHNAIGARVRSLPITPDRVLQALGVI